MRARRTLLTPHVLILLVTLGMERASGDILKEEPVDLKGLPAHGGFVSSNESGPTRLRPLLVAHEKIHLSVGADRAVFGAILTKASGLVVLDLDPRITFFHRINRDLLLLSRGDRRKYVFYRRSAKFEEWSAAVEASENPRLKESVLKAAESWTWWNEEFRSKISGYDPIPSPGDLGSTNFTGVNYPEEAAGFDSIYDLAAKGNYEAHTLPIGSGPAIDRFRDAVVASRRKIGSVDLSNAWQPHFISETAMNGFFEGFADCFEDGTQFVVTDMGGEYENYWKFFVFKFSDLKKAAAGQYGRLFGTLGDHLKAYAADTRTESCSAKLGRPSPALVDLVAGKK